MVEKTLALTCALALFACSDDDETTCPVAPVDEGEAQIQVTDLCNQEGILCTFEQDTRLAFTSGSEVFVSPVRCAEDINLCLFAVWHEFGHVLNGDNEAVADCYAATHATADQVEAALCFFDTTTFSTDEATHGTASERAERIRACQ